MSTIAEGKQSKEDVAEKAARRFPSKWLVWGVIMVIAISSVVVWRLDTQRQQLADARLQALQMRIDTIQQSLQDTHTQANGNRLSIEKMMRANSDGGDAWILQEARYLVDLAHFALMVHHDVSLSTALLQAADARICDAHNPKWLSIRKALAQDIAELEAAPKVDVDGIYVQLQALAQEVAQLPLYKTQVEHEMPSKQQTDQRASLWNKVWISSWQAIRQVMVIRHHEQAIEPLLSASQHALLNLHIQVLFAQAEWALLQRQPVVYHASLQALQKIVQRYFLGNSDKTDGVMQALDGLIKTNIAPTLPRIDNAARAIQEIST